ncbi:hypothetical protein GBA52_014279 [Prunus armeniaca]|nr:hypothetical protein GBA52_014279 [Prunus armeniaca]
MQVTNEDYESCNPASPIAVYASGSDTITLERPDNFYFLCGAPGHCQAGQRVEILATLPTPDDSFTSPSPTPSASPADAMSPSSALSSGPALHFSELGLGVTMFVLSTLLVREPYRVVVRAFKTYFLSFCLQRVYNSSEGLELCFEEKPGFREYAGMTVHFQGADFVVQASYMYLHNTEKGYFCVAMLPSTEGTVWSGHGSNKAHALYMILSRDNSSLLPRTAQRTDFYLSICVML